MPQIGPGLGVGNNNQEDFGREGVTGNSADRYQFKVPSLRNVAITGPWGHAGAYGSLRAMVQHYRNSRNAMADYSPNQHDPILLISEFLPDIDFTLIGITSVATSIGDSSEVNRGGGRGRGPRRGPPGRDGPGGGLSGGDVDNILAFLNSLTDPNMVDLINQKPTSVPSGLSVD